MRNVSLAALAASVSVVLSLGTASAADLGAPPAPAPVYVKAPVAAPFSWNGLYIGAHGGYAEANFDFFTSISGTPNQQSKGGFGGLQLGYNVQRGNFVIGLESDGSFGHMTDLVHDGNFITETSDVKAFGSARGRVGYAFGRVLPYATGGLGWANVTLGENCPPGVQFAHCKAFQAGYQVTDNQTYFGWTAGGGLEVAIDQNWSLKAEYLHADLGTKLFPFDPPQVSPRSPNLTMDIVKAGVNYRIFQ
jgi:outer membrane immunogenic protein